MGKITFLELVVKILTEGKRPLTPVEIWEIAKIKGYDKDLGSRGETPWLSIGAQIYVNMRDKKDSPFVMVGSRPRRFFLKSLFEKEKDIEKEIPPEKEKTKFSEEDLHPFVTYYSYIYLKAYTKTIKHQKSTKGEYAEWIHPDIVGCYFPINEWIPEVLELSSQIGNTSTKLYSFELKKELSFKNLRESFFQTVSNSSWANESYLVAAKIANEDDFLEELSRLATSFGIGIIEINISEPDSSRILFPARNKENLDWDTINKLADLNGDFKNFLKRIKNDIVNKDIVKEQYNKIIEKEKLIELIKVEK